VTMICPLGVGVKFPIFLPDLAKSAKGFWSIDYERACDCVNLLGLNSSIKGRRRYVHSSAGR
jgi:hypothetical protein